MIYFVYQIYQAHMVFKDDQAVSQFFETSILHINALYC